MLPLLLTVEASFPLTGLGLLVQGGSSTGRLSETPLHTRLPVAVRLPDGTRLPAIASVEELSRPAENGSREQRVLLLETDDLPPLPAGTQVWLREDHLPAS